MLEALPDGKSTASTLMEPNSRLMLPPALAIAARSAAVGAWLYPTSKWSFDGADAAVDAPAISANALTASARRNTFKCLSPPNDSWNGRLFDRRAASYPQRHCREGPHHVQRRRNDRGAADNDGGSQASRRHDRRRLGPVRPRAVPGRHGRRVRARISRPA